MTQEETAEMEQRIKEAQTLCDGFNFPETDLIHSLPLPTPFGMVLNEAAAKIDFDPMGGTVTKL